jgi:hypothetical protein
MKKRTKYILIAILLTWVAAITIFTVPNLVALHKEKVSVESVLQAYTDDLIAGQFDKAYELCGPDFRLQLSATQFIEQQAQLQQKYGRLLSIKRQGMKLSGTGEPVFWSGQYSADLNYEHATRPNQPYSVERRWSVDGQPAGVLDNNNKPFDFEILKLSTETNPPFQIEYGNDPPH